MAARDYYSYLSIFDLEYKKAFARQQGVPEQLIDTLTADGSAEGLDDYLITHINICPQYENSLVHERDNTYFLHRANTYPRRCHTCNINTDRDYNRGFHGHPEAEIVPRHAGEGIEPMTPENYQRYDQILRDERKEAREKRERDRERERERARKALEEKRIRLNLKRQRRAEHEAAGRIGAQTLDQGYCPIMLDYVDKMVISKKCGHGMGVEAWENRQNDVCPICRKENVFTIGNTVTLPTKQGKEKLVAAQAVKAKQAKKAAESKPAGKRSGVLGKFADRLGLGGKKTRRRKHKKSAKKNKTKRTRTKVKKDRKNKTKRK